MRYYLFTGIAGAVSLSMTGCGGSGQQDSHKPNIIFIIADDLGYSDPGCYGQQLIQTPNIDALAASGLRFTQYYSGSPVSAPSRCILLTGMHSGHSFIRGNHEWAERGDVWDFSKMEADPSLEGQYPIPAETVTFSKILQHVGYKTACIGKWGLGAPFTDGVPNRQGFDFFFGYNCQRQAHTYYPTHLWRNESIVKLNNRFVAPRTRELDGDPYREESYERYNLNDYAPALMLEEALSFIKASKNEPFFLHFTTTIPHVPLQAPKEWVDRYHNIIGEEEPYNGDRGYFPCRYPMATYAAMVGYLDYQVGRMVDELVKLGIYENTLIFFTSDNGPVTTGGAVSSYFENAWPFNQDPNRLKGSLYEGGIRVPMIIAWPGVIKKAGVIDHICASYDIFPTICDIAGADHSGNLDGISMLPIISGKGKQKEHPYLYWEYPERRGQQAVRIDDWKGIRENTRDGNMEIKLFDLSVDITEENDVSKENPGVTEQIIAIMEKEHQKPEIDRFDLFLKN
ncbi:MAG TPA: arylsulfatase [Bacteroidales bacterium]|nr:arylsulfatase [Bacteroidales bacterium]HPJ60625.1 arylsulfatase [Bacteroidales bacterium]HRW86478.1 arylsulfatase [Bacteroidales bacterium]